MSAFNDIISQLEAFAEHEWEVIKADAIAIEQAVEPVIESAFHQLVQQFGMLAVQTVTGLMTGAQASLSGGEKFNLTVTTIVDAAEKAAVQIVQSDASALAKNAYLAVMATAPKAP
jgi:hypothetical protein